MAAPFEKRTQIALENPAFRTGDFAQLIAEGNELAAQQRVIATQAAAEAIDFGLSEADRDEAAANAERAKRNAAALSAAVEALTARHAERRASEKSQAAEAERAAVIAERDEIASRFRAIVPEAVTALTDLFAQVQANAARMKRAGVHQLDAELIARDLRGSSFPSGGMVLRFTEMKVPSWDGKRRAWPPEHIINPAAMVQQLAEGRRKARAQKAAREAEWGHYRLTPPRGGSVIEFRFRLTPTQHVEKPWTLRRDPWEGEVKHAEAERLRGLGVTAEPIAPAGGEQSAEFAEAAE